MDKPVLVYQPGSIIVCTQGEYSDFGIIGFLVAVQTIDVPALAKKYHDAHRAKVKPKNRYWDKADPTGFPSWLIAQGYAMPVDHSTVHIGDYGDWNDEFGIKRDELTS